MEEDLMDAAMPRLRVVTGKPMERIVSNKASPARTCGAELYEMRYGFRC